MPHVVNWIWQGCVVAATAALALGLMRRCRAQSRYVASLAALLAVLALPLVPAAGSGAFPDASGAIPADALVALPAGWWSSAVPVTIAWAAWCLVSGVRLVRGVVGLLHERSRCRPFPPELEQRLAGWLSVRTRARRPRLALSSGVHAAAVLGLGRPIIAVSPSLLRHLDPDAIDRVIVHEWAHVRRRDDVGHLLHALIHAIAGWHPAVWWLQRQLALERELACDETAVAVTGCPRRYAASLATLATIFVSRRPPLAAAGVLSSPALRTRIVRILSAPRLASPRRSAVVASLAVGLLAAVTTAVAALPLVATGPPGRVRAAGGAPLAPPETPRRPEPEPLRTAAAQAGGTSRRAIPDRKWIQSAGDEGRFPVVRSADPLVASGRVPASSPPVAAPGEDVTASVAAFPAPLPRVAPPVRHAGTRPAEGSEAASPWRVAADAGIAVGRGSQKAASTASGVFTRFGRKMATIF